jgi:hypothetical protein
VTVGSTSDITQGEGGALPNCALQGVTRKW